MKIKEPKEGRDNVMENRVSRAIESLSSEMNDDDHKWAYHYSEF